MRDKLTAKGQDISRRSPPDADGRTQVARQSIRQNQHKHRFNGGCRGDTHLRDAQTRVSRKELAEDRKSFNKNLTAVSRAALAKPWGACTPRFSLVSTKVPSSPLGSPDLDCQSLDLSTKKGGQLFHSVVFPLEELGSRALFVSRRRTDRNG